jgi:hypothetical protein
MNGPPPPPALRNGLEQIDRMIAAGQLRFPTASESLRHWRDGGARDRVLTASAFQAERFLLDHLAEAHRPRLINGARRRLTSGELAPGRGVVEIDWTDSLSAPHFTDLYFALGEFAVHSRVRAAVDQADGSLVLRFEHWGVEIAGDYDWDPATMALMPSADRMTREELLALEMSGRGRRYRIRSEWATITDPRVIAPAILPAGNY